MDEQLTGRIDTLRDFFELAPDARLIPEIPNEGIEIPAGPRLDEFNIEWHVIPSDEAVPFDETYARRLYSTCGAGFRGTRRHTPNYFDELRTGHRRHQGTLMGVETTRKPHYLPGNRQNYGTMYGFEDTADPFRRFISMAGFTTASRYAHDYKSLRHFVNVTNEAWKAEGLMPKGYRLTICPPAVFNLIGTVFHPEWSESEPLELGFYRDDRGNAKCYAVGSNCPGDYSYIREIEFESEWTLLGFRIVLVPED